MPSDAEPEQKFRWLVAPVFGEGRTATLVEMIWEFEGVNGVGELIGLCGGL